MMQAAGAGTSTASLGRSPAYRLVRSSQGLCYAHWRACWAFPVDGVRGTGPAGARAELDPEVQTAPFRSHWHDEVATTGLPADEGAQARSRIEDQHCRLGHARTLGRTEHLQHS